MRDVEPGLVDDLVPVDEQVEVDDARPPALTAHAPERALDLEQAGRAAARAGSVVSSATAPFRNGGWSTTPTGSVSRSCETASTSTPSALPEELDRPAQRLLARSEVRAEPDVRERHARVRSTTTAA